MRTAKVNSILAFPSIEMVISTIRLKGEGTAPLFERRRQRELSAYELCAIMREEQGATYSAALDATTLHPYMWAANPHYYGSSFNFPYAFGLLFGLDLYAAYQREPRDFGSPAESWQAPCK